MTLTTTLYSLNSWSGSCAGFHSFLSRIIKKGHYLALQEVHQARHQDVPRRIMPQNPGSRISPIRAHLSQELDRKLARGWHTKFVPHIDGCHDLERDDRLQFGQYSAVKAEAFDVIYTGRKFIYGRHNQFNTEDIGGKPCGKVAIGHLLRRRHTDEYLAVVNVHGFWSKEGKCDQTERFVQNEGINALISRLCDHAPTNQVHVVVLGDLNYTSRMIALYDLAQQPCFGYQSGVILNHVYGVKETRTSLYLKPVREADFAIVSRSLLPHVKNFRVQLDGVPSDHGLLELTLNL